MVPPKKKADAPQNHVGYSSSSEEEAHKTEMQRRTSSVMRRGRSRSRESGTGSLRILRPSSKSRQRCQGTSQSRNRQSIATNSQEAASSSGETNKKAQASLLKKDSGSRTEKQAKAIPGKKGQGNNNAIASTSKSISRRPKNNTGTRGRGRKLYSVERIVESRYRAGGKEFLVKWEGYPESQNSWVARNGLYGCEDVINDFENGRTRTTVTIGRNDSQDSSSSSTGSESEVSTLQIHDLEEAEVGSEDLLINDDDRTTAEAEVDEAAQIRWGYFELMIVFLLVVIFAFTFKIYVQMNEGCV